MNEEDLQKYYPHTIISERWAEATEEYPPVYAAYHPKIDCITGCGSTHDEARADLLKNRYDEYLRGKKQGIIGAGLWK